MAGNLVRQYGPMAMSAGNALFHPMNGRAPSVRTAMNPRSERQQALGVRSAATEGVPSNRPTEGRTTARDRTVSGPATLSRNQLRAKRAELEAQLASLDTIAAGSSSGANEVSASSTYRVPSATTAAARSVSAGPNYPLYRSAGAISMTPAAGAAPPTQPSNPTRIERSFVSEGYDEIRPEEAADPDAAFVTTPGSARVRTSGAGFWGWFAPEGNPSKAGPPSTPIRKNQ